MPKFNQYARFKEASEIFNKTVSKLENKQKPNFDDWFEIELNASDLHASVFAFRKSLLKFLTDEFPNNPWSWYHYSTFLKYYTAFNKKAFESARNAVEVLRKTDDYIGAISRHFIVIAIEREEYGLVDEEIDRLNNNPNTDSTILYGVAEDILDHLPRGSLNQFSIEVLNRHAKNADNQ